MVSRRLGRTDLLVTPLGFGAFKVGRAQGHKYPDFFQLPDDQAADRLLNGVLDLGIRYIDTAPAYGLSEERIGRFIGHRRAEYVLSTKVGETFEDGRSTFDFSRDAIRASVQCSMRRLRADVLDVAYIHAHADDLAILHHTDAVPALLALRDEGRVRAVGLSGKTVAAATQAMEWADVLMIEFHCHDQSQAALLDQAAARGVGIVVKKGLASGRLPYDEAIRFVLGCPAVTSMVVGGLSLEHMRQNVAVANTTAPADICSRSGYTP